MTEVRELTIEEWLRLIETQGPISEPTDDIEISDQEKNDTSKNSSSNTYSY